MHLIEIDVAQSVDVAALQDLGQQHLGLWVCDFVARRVDEEGACS